MLKNLHILNFQAHQNTQIEFSPYVTAIVGLNNHGKSAVIRSIQKVLRNEPEGTGFIRDYTKECQIMIETDRGTVMRQVKSDGSSDANAYTVNGVEFVKFGRTGIPEEVLDVLGCSPVQMFGDVDFDLNFSHQLDPLFLVVGQGLPSVRGKVLGKITGMDSIQRAIQMASSEEKSLSQSLKDVKERDDKLAEVLKGYSHLDELILSLQPVLNDSLEYEKVSNKGKMLEDLRESIKACVKEAKRQKALMEVLDVDFSPDFEEYDKCQIKIDLCTKVGHFQKEILKLEVQSDIEIPSLSELEEMDKRIDELQMLQSEDILLSNLIGEGVGQEMFISKSLIKAEEELHKLQDELGVCPVCEKPFND
jgi:exonuclease SbcC